MAATQQFVDLQVLKSRHSLADTVEAAGIALKGKGRVRQGFCPFHDEREGSFTVYADTERWHCFGCGENGDLLDFIQRTENITLPEAVQWLESGLGTASLKDTAAPKARLSTPDSHTRRDPVLLSQAMGFYVRQLQADPVAQSYLVSRGMSPATARRLGLGYSPARGLRGHLTSLGYSQRRITESGLFMGHRERFAGMVVVPEVTGKRVTWLMGRSICPGTSPRFQAIPGRKPILGLSRLGRTPDYAILTEGLFDWLTLVQWGYPVCAALGTQGMERVAEALGHCRRVFLAFDNDEAGRTAAGRLKALLGNKAVSVQLPGRASDAGDLATIPQGVRLFHRALTQAATSRRFNRGYTHSKEGLALTEVCSGKRGT